MLGAVLTPSSKQARRLPTPSFQPMLPGAAPPSPLHCVKRGDSCRRELRPHSKSCSFVSPLYQVQPAIANRRQHVIPRDARDKLPSATPLVPRARAGHGQRPRPLPGQPDGEGKSPLALRTEAPAARTIEPHSRALCRTAWGRQRVFVSVAPAIGDALRKIKRLPVRHLARLGSVAAWLNVRAGLEIWHKNSRAADPSRAPQPSARASRQRYPERLCSSSQPKDNGRPAPIYLAFPSRHRGAPPAPDTPPGPTTPPARPSSGCAAAPTTLSTPLHPVADAPSTPLSGRSRPARSRRRCGLARKAAVFVLVRPPPRGLAQRPSPAFPCRH